MQGTVFTITEGSSFLLDITLTDSSGETLTPISALHWWVSRPGETIPLLAIQSVDPPVATTTLHIPNTVNVCSTPDDILRSVVVRVESGEHTLHQWFNYTLMAHDSVPYPTG